MEADPPYQSLVSLVQKEYGKLKRGSYGVNEALEKAKQANENSLDGIILEQGEIVWRAYFAAKKATELKHGFSGKAELGRLLDDLSVEPIQNHRVFAKRLAASVMNNDQPSEESNTLLSESHGVNGAKRRRTAATDGYAIPIVMPNDATTIPAAMPNDAATPLTSLEHYATEQVPGKKASLKDVYVGAPLDPARDLFHDQFWDSIERMPSKGYPDTWLADITIFSQQGDKREHFGYQMEIGITSEKVAEYALEYFGVKVEVKDGVRYVRYSGGGIVEPDPSIKLRVCERDLSRIFRGELFEAHRTSPVYQSEEKKKLSHTNSVSMTISNQAKEGGKMTVFMGEWRAVRIKEKFYG